MSLLSVLKYFLIFLSLRLRVLYERNYAQIKIRFACIQEKKEKKTLTKSNGTKSRKNEIKSI